MTRERGEWTHSGGTVLLDDIRDLLLSSGHGQRSGWVVTERGVVEEESQNGGGVMEMESLVGKIPVAWAVDTLLLSRECIEVGELVYGLEYYCHVVGRLHDC